MTNLEQQRADRQREHQAEMRRILETNRALYEEQIQLCAHPSEAAQAVFEFELVNVRLAQSTIKDPHNNPDLVLTALDNTEAWYTQRGYDYPFPERLQEQRLYWENRRDQAK